MSLLNTRSLQPGERIRVLIVDDSVVTRRLVTRALEAEPGLNVIGVAANGAIALQRIPQYSPDVVTLDIEMPEMDGIETLRRIRGQYPHLRVVMFSALTERGAAVTMEALTLGADDYVTKPSNEGAVGRSLDSSITQLRAELIPRIKQFFRMPENGSTAPALEKPGSTAGRLRARGIQPPAKIVAIGVSTGGPTALGAVLPMFPTDFPLPVLIVQHMPPLFTRLLAERLNATCNLPVSEAIDGSLVQPGTILVAPGDFHMKVVSAADGIRIKLDRSSPQNSCRPAVDALFTSIGEVYGGAVIAAILTGMGQDGLRGAEVLDARGASILAQDEMTSVVWGMPGAVVNAGLAGQILPLHRIVPEIVRLAGRN